MLFLSCTVPREELHLQKRKWRNELPIFAEDAHTMARPVRANYIARSLYLILLRHCLESFFFSFALCAPPSPWLLRTRYLTRLVPAWRRSGGEQCLLQGVGTERKQNKNENGK